MDKYFNHKELVSNEMVLGSNCHCTKIAKLMFWRLAPCTLLC